MVEGSGDGDASSRALRAAHPTERAVGIEHYVGDVDGVGGRLRARPEDFRVRELERVEPEPLDADPGAYAHLVLRATLRDWETNDFASALSDRLGISRERVDWAGTKDKRAVTTQLFSVAGGTGDDAVDPDALAAVSLRGAEVDVLGRFGRSIELGDLAGNEFAVTVAEPERPELAGDVTATLAAFARGGLGDGRRSDSDSGSADAAASDPVPGDLAPSDSAPGDPAPDEPVSVAVPNYFGQQRFGSRRPITHEVGLAIVRGDWREAVRTYVADAFESEPESTREARAAAGDRFDDGDYAGALEALPNRLDYERALLHALADSSGDDVDEAAGSGDPDVGDAGNEYRAALDALPRNLQRLFVHAAQSCAFNRILSERLERGLPFHRPVEGDVACFAERDAPASSHELAPATDVSLPDADRTQRVTADRVDSVARHCERGRAFVTAPLVGTETELGDGEPGEIERAVLEDLGLAKSDFDLPEPYDSTGTRRAILVRTSLAVDRDAATGDGASSDDGSDAESGLTFRFALPKGSYATVLLREYLKVDPVELG